MRQDLGMNVMFKNGKDFHCGTFLELERPITKTTIKYALKTYLVEYEFTNLSPKNVDEMIIVITDGEDVIKFNIDPCEVWPTRECLENPDPLFEL